MKKIIWIMIILVTTFGFCSCGKAVKENTKNIISNEANSSTENTDLKNGNTDLKSESSISTQKQSNESSDSVVNNSNETIESGLLLGLSSFSKESRTENDDPKPINSKYKTIWIAPKDSKLRYIEKEGIIVAPGLDGFYGYKNETVTKKKEYEEGNTDSKFYDVEINKMISYKVGNKYILPKIEDNPLVYYSETNNLLFVGNNYSVTYKSTIYTSGAGGYQYVPSINLNKIGSNIKSWVEKGYDEKKDSSLPLMELLDTNSKKSVKEQIDKYKKEFDKTVNVESEDDKEYMSEDNLSLERREGSWRLKVPLMFSNWKGSHNDFKDFKEIDFKLPVTLVSHDTLCMKWEDIKKVEPDLVDAVSSPDKKLLVVQTSKSLKVYRVLQGGLGNLEMKIPIGANERIILNQWATGKFVLNWDAELSKILK